MSHHIKVCLVVCSAEVIPLQHGTDDLLGNAIADDIASRIVAQSRSVKNEYIQVYIKGLKVRKNKPEEKEKQVSRLINLLCHAVFIMEFIDNTNVTKGMLDKLHLNLVSTKVLVNNICKLVSEQLAEACEVKKLSKKEDVSDLNSSLSCSNDLTLQNPGFLISKKNKSGNEFSKLRELRF